MNLKSLSSNWKTTSAGLIMIGYSLVDLGFAIYGKTVDPHSVKSTIVSIVGGIGLILAGDAASSVTKTEADTTFITKPGATPLVPPAANPPAVPNPAKP
jgi:hypothetical protein